MRDDLFVTTSTLRTSDLADRLTVRAQEVAAELDCPVVARRKDALAEVFDRCPGAARAVVVRDDHWVLAARDGWEFFFHPNTAYLRLGNLLRGGRDLLVEAAGLREGDSVLDATLGLGAEAVLCAHVVGETGEVHGVEAIPEMGVVVREGLRTRRTISTELNAAMRRVVVVHLGDHLNYLRACPDRRYDVVCFDPFFDRRIDPHEALGALRAFGEHAPLLPETIAEARRVARRRVVVKSARHSSLLERLGIVDRVEARTGKVVYGVIAAA